MKYFKNGKGEFIKNGQSLVRVRPVQAMQDPMARTRTVRILQVIEVVKLNPENPIERGQMLALSFPNAYVNANSYTWNDKHRVVWEPSQVPMQISDRAVARLSAGKN